jgi:hypothetical protein
MKESKGKLIMVASGVALLISLAFLETVILVIA